MDVAEKKQKEFVCRFEGQKDDFLGLKDAEDALFPTESRWYEACVRREEEIECIVVEWEPQMRLKGKGKFGQTFSWPLMAAGTRLFVGNIAWNTTEEELQELFSRVGEARFDLHREKGTSKSSGYGFVDFKDAQSALQALQKFNGFEVNGRELNVDFPSQSTKQAGAAGSSTSSSKASPFAQAKTRDVQRQAPMKATPGSTSQKVNSVMDSLPSAEIYDILMSLKEDPEAGRRHLQTNPSLAYALLQAQVILGFIPIDKAPSFFVGYEASAASSAMAVSETNFSAQTSSSTAQTQPPSHAQTAPNTFQAQPQPINHASGAPPMQQTPNLAALVRMPPQQLAAFGISEQFKTLVNIVHTWSQRTLTEFEQLRPEQQASIRRIFEEAQVPLPSRR